jgi:hypothetical protein
VSDRANYVLVEGGQPRIHFSRWGALSIPALLLSGPDATVTFVRGLTLDAELLNDTWAEGGLLIDMDARLARFWGGQHIQRRPFFGARSSRRCAICGRDGPSSGRSTASPSWPASSVRISPVSTTSITTIATV